ncbi:DUF3098 domain-containing protein [Salisaeta longa]|uniref:DUF3098 domain-containing protein n=1 Tax=Salisaeta longa TaxID=503170 RepID=UPI0003B6124E|nr:DUF3098 domain-containing protein [Salisaeta longa]
MAQSPSGSRSRRSRSNTPVFQQRNYTLLLVGLVCIVLGFGLMRLENEFLGVISLYVAPLIILFGYLEIIYAILWRPARPDDAEA